MAAAADGAPARKRYRATKKVSPFYAEFLASLGPETELNQRIYLVTISRVLPSTTGVAAYRDLSTLSREDVGRMVKDAFDDPIATRAGGRPRGEDGGGRVEFLAVAKEFHADGSPHFHVVVKLRHRMRFMPAKATLQQRHHVPSHWSSTHSQLWSAVRYIHVPSPKKPRVDPDIWTWTEIANGVDLTELSREPFTAQAWRQAREAREAKAAAEASRMPSFNKLDLMPLVLSKHLHSKTQLLAYVQDHGSPAAQLFVSKQQRRLTEFIDDAHEWADAKAEAVVETMSDWDILCQAAARPCPHGPGQCSYARAVAEIFSNNAATLCPRRLASALKAVLCHGPSKTCRVPFLVGASNTGKSTLVYPFDDLFGPKHVFHKPALGSTFALRNIVKKKRFIFWDDFRPVEFAHKDTIPVGTFLSLFIGKDTEIQVSQSFNDGNLDVAWRRGVVLTAKDEGLWASTCKVPPEDVRHLRNRVEEFRFTHEMFDVRDVESCAPCMARWITRYADEPAPHAAGFGRGGVEYQLVPP